LGISIFHRLWHSIQDRLGISIFHVTSGSSPILWDGVKQIAKLGAFHRCFGLGRTSNLASAGDHAGQYNLFFGRRAVQVGLQGRRVGLHGPFVVSPFIRGVGAETLNGPKIVVALHCVVGIAESQQAADGNNSVSLQALITVAWGMYPAMLEEEDGTRQMTSKEPPSKMTKMNKLGHKTIFEASTILCPAINAVLRCYRMLQAAAFEDVI
jgi:hypothetical protein